MMKQSISEYRQYFFASVLMHGILLAFLLLSVEAPLKTNQLSSNPVEIVQAVVVDEKKVSEEVNQLQAEDQQKNIAAEKEQKQLAQKLEQVKREREVEQTKLEVLKKDMAKAKQEEQERLAEIKLVKEKEKKQLEELKEEKEKEKKRLVALDDQRQAEQDRVKQMRIEREKEEKKRVEITKQQQAAKKRKAEETKRAVAAKTATEAERALAENRTRVSTEVNRIQTLWHKKISDNRRKILGVEMDPNLSCIIQMNILPDGSIQVRLVQSSGNAVYDDLSVKAIYKSQPFQLPEDPLVREEVKIVRMTFNSNQGEGL